MAHGPPMGVAQALGSFYFLCWSQTAPRMTPGAILNSRNSESEKKIAERCLGLETTFLLVSGGFVRK